MNDTICRNSTHGKMSCIVAGKILQANALITKIFHVICSLANLLNESQIVY